MEKENKSEYFLEHKIDKDYRFQKLLFANNLDKFRESLNKGVEIHHSFCVLSDLLYNLLELLEIKDNN